jgi:PAS domain-containing protein
MILGTVRADPHRQQTRGPLSITMAGRWMAAEKRNSGSGSIAAAHESARDQRVSIPALSGRPPDSDLADLNEQLRTENEELRRQLLELHLYRSQDEHAIHGAQWQARIVENNPDPVLQVSIDGTVQYRNSASSALCGRWNPEDELLVPPSIHNLVEAACTRAEVIRREMTVGEHVYSITIAPAPTPAHYVNLYAREITDRKRAEKARHESETRLSLALSGTRVGMYERDVITGEIRGTGRRRRRRFPQYTTTITGPGASTPMIGRG